MYPPFAGIEYIQYLTFYRQLALGHLFLPIAYVVKSIQTTVTIFP